MKRLIGLLLLLAIAPALFGQQGTVIGVVTYRMDVMSPEIEALGESLNSAVDNAYVDTIEIKAAEFCARDSFSERLSRISHWVEFMEAVHEHYDFVADGLVATPPPTVADTEPMQAELGLIAADFPVMLALRRVPGLDLPVVGIDMVQLGVAFAEQMSKHGTHPFAVMGFFGDPNQSDFLEGLKTSPDFRGAYEVLELDGRGESTDAVFDHPDLEVLIVTDITHVAGAAETTQYMLTEYGQEIRLAVLGAPENWGDLISDKGLLHGMITWNQYDVLLQAVQAVEQYLLNDIPLESIKTDAIFYGGSAEPQTLSYPYTDLDVWSEFWE